MLIYRTCYILGWKSYISYNPISYIYIHLHPNISQLMEIPIFSAPRSAQIRRLRWDEVRRKVIEFTRFLRWNAAKISWFFEIRIYIYMYYIDIYILYISYIYIHTSSCIYIYVLYRRFWIAGPHARRSICLSRPPSGLRACAIAAAWRVPLQTSGASSWSLSSSSGSLGFASRCGSLHAWVPL